MLYATYTAQNFADISEAILRFMQWERRQLDTAVRSGDSGAGIALRSVRSDRAF